MDRYISEQNTDANLIGSPEEREPVLEESVDLAQGEPLDRRTLDGHHDERYVRIRRFLRSSRRRRRRRRLSGRSRRRRRRHDSRRLTAAAAAAADGFLALNVVVEVTMLVLLLLVMVMVVVVVVPETRLFVRRLVLGLHYQQHRVHRVKKKKTPRRFPRPKRMRKNDSAVICY